MKIVYKSTLNKLLGATTDSDILPASTINLLTIEGHSRSLDLVYVKQYSNYYKAQNSNIVLYLKEQI